MSLVFLLDLISASDWGCHVSAIHNINQDLTSKEREINQILTKEEEKFEKTKTTIIDQRKTHAVCTYEITACTTK
jgi:hypothetical protein